MFTVFLGLNNILIKHVANVWSQIYEMSDKYTYTLKRIIKSTIKMRHYDFTGQCVELVTF